MEFYQGCLARYSRFRLTPLLLMPILEFSGALEWGLYLGYAA